MSAEETRGDINLSFWRGGGGVYIKHSKMIGSNKNKKRYKGPPLNRGQIQIRDDTCMNVKALIDFKKTT